MGASSSRSRPVRCSVYQNGTIGSSPAIDLSSRVCTDIERGLVGIAVDPGFADYALRSTSSTPMTRGRTAAVPTRRTQPRSPSTASRDFVLGNDNVIDPSSETGALGQPPHADGQPHAGDMQLRQGRLPVRQRRRRRLRLQQRQQLRTMQQRLSLTRMSCSGRSFESPRTGRCRRTIRSWGRTRPLRSDRANHARQLVSGDLCLGTSQPVPVQHWTRTRRRPASSSTTSARITGRRSISASAGRRLRLERARGSLRRRRPAPTAARHHSGMTNPIYDYDHSAGCTAITGGAFVPDGLWPSAVRRRLSLPGLRLREDVPTHARRRRRLHSERIRD